MNFEQLKDAVLGLAIDARETTMRLLEAELGHLKEWRRLKARVLSIFEDGGLIDSIDCEFDQYQPAGAEVIYVEE